MCGVIFSALRTGSGCRFSPSQFSSVPALPLVFVQIQNRFMSSTPALASRILEILELKTYRVSRLKESFDEILPFEVPSATSVPLSSLGNLSEHQTESSVPCPLTSSASALCRKSSMLSRSSSINTITPFPRHRRPSKIHDLQKATRCDTKIALHDKSCITYDTPVAIQGTRIAFFESRCRTESISRRARRRAAGGDRVMSGHVNQRDARVGLLLNPWTLLDLRLGDSKLSAPPHPIHEETLLRNTGIVRTRAAGSFADLNTLSNFKSPSSTQAHAVAPIHRFFQYSSKISFATLSSSIHIASDLSLFTSCNLAQIAPALISWRLATFYAPFFSPGSHAITHAILSNPLSSLSKIQSLLASIDWSAAQVKLKEQQNSHARRKRIVSGVENLLGPKGGEKVLRVGLDSLRVVRKAAALASCPARQILLAVEAFALFQQRSMAESRGGSSPMSSGRAHGGRESSSRIPNVRDAVYHAEYIDFETLARIILEDLDDLGGAMGSSLFWTFFDEGSARDRNLATDFGGESSKSSSPSSSSSSSSFSFSMRDTTISKGSASAWGLLQQCILADVEAAIRRCKTRYFRDVSWNDQSYRYGWCGWRQMKKRRLLYALSNEEERRIASVELGPLLDGKIRPGRWV